MMKLNQLYISIQQCSDKRKWYANQVGEFYPLIEVCGDEYKTRAADGYINFIERRDAIITKLIEVNVYE